MKKRLFTLLSFILCLTFFLSGCNLFVENSIIKNNQIAVSAGEITLTREELVKGYNNYYSTFYNNNNKNADAAMQDLIEYLIAKKLYINDARKIFGNNFSEEENNYLWYSVYTALINNIKSFEEKIRKELKIENNEEEELEQESQFVYTPYDKKAIYNKETGKISIIKSVLVETTNEETGEKIYKYVPIEERDLYQIEDIFNSEYIKNLINKNKLFEGQNDLTVEQELDKNISKEAIRRYMVQLKKNEEGKNLSIDIESIFEREIERIYKIVEENLLINKLYKHKVSQINISEEDVLNVYLEKVKECYERYLLDKDAFVKELTTRITSNSKSIKDIFYVPKNENENYFYVNHIVIKLSEKQIQQINEAKQTGKGMGWENGGKEYYEDRFAEIVDMSKIKLDERDENGYIILKSTDEGAISLADMFSKLEADLAEIDAEYEVTNKIVNHLTDENYYAYINARADKFNEYIYKYSDDTGTLQIQNTYYNKLENWYTYALGTNKTDASFMEQFVSLARNLHFPENENGFVTDFDITLMEKWETDSTTGIETLTGSLGYSIIMYCGEVNNLFESFNEEDFSINSLPNNALQVMDYHRLGLTMNKTLFDLIFEECYNKIYDNIIAQYEDSILNDSDIIKNTKVYSDLIR